MARKGTATAYEDVEISPEEQAAIEESSASNELPPPDDQPVTTEELKPEDKPAAEEPAATEAPAEKPAAGPAPVDEDAEFAAFLEKNKGKSPEELQRLLFQQSKRANRAGAEARVATQALQNLGDRAKAALERRNAIAQAAPEAKAGFREKLKTDPDAATAELHDKLVDRELSDADRDADQARFEEAVAFGAAHLPNFDEAWPEMRALANEIGYSDEEINGIRDGRDIVTLGLARYAARAIKAGIMAPDGSMKSIPGPTTEATDPRLQVKDPVRTVGQGGAGAADRQRTTDEQLSDMLKMSDADFDKLDPAVLENILRAAG